METEDRRPLAQFQRVAQVIRDRITNGEYPVGSQLPAIATLAEDFGCSHMTIKQAIAALGSEGVLTSRRGVRAEVVAPPSTKPPLTIAERLNRVERQVDDLSSRLGTLEDHAFKSTVDPPSQR